MAKRVRRVPRVVMSKLVKRVRDSRGFGRVITIDLACIPDGYSTEEAMSKLRKVFYGT